MRPPRPDELTDGAVHDYVICYPSGARFRVFGRLTQGHVHRGPTIRDGDDVMELDPRAVITRDGLVIYEPRRWVDRGGGRLAWVAAWLAAHPEWPAIARDTEPEPWAR